MSRPTPNPRVARSRCLVAVFTFDNGTDLRATLSRFGAAYPYDVVVHVDGSTDGSDGCCADFPFPVLRAGRRGGIGASIRNVLAYAEAKGYEAIAILPGNNKNDPQQVDRLLGPLLRGEADYVQGSRFLDGGAHPNTPVGRLVAIRIFSFLLSLLARRRCTDALEGMRAYRVALPRELSLDLSQSWLDAYELETYLHFHALRSPRCRYAEVHVTKAYPAKKRGLVFNRKGTAYSHIRPFLDWWKIVRPVVFVLFRLRR